MAEFKGIKQVFVQAYNDTPKEDKIGYLWFVRKDTDDVYGDIFYGSRHYGHWGNEVDLLVEKLKTAGVIDKEGNAIDINGLIDALDNKFTEAIESVTAATVELFDSLDGKFDAKGAAESAAADALAQATADTKAQIEALDLANTYDAKGAAESAAVDALAQATADTKAQIEALDLANTYEEKGAAAAALEAATADTKAQIDAVNADIDVMAGAITALTEEIEDLKEKEVTFEEGDGIEITGSTISSNAEGKTTEDIIIQDGAIAANGIWKDNIIPAGTSVQEILIKLLSTEKWDTTTPSETKSFNVVINGLKVSLNKVTNVEVGDEITVTITKGTSSATQTYSVKTFDYGYKIGNDGEYVNSKSYIETLTPNCVSENDANSATFEKFVDANGNALGTIDNPDSTITAYAVEGTNKVTVSQEGNTYASQNVEGKVFYIATNMGNYTISKDNDSPRTFTATGMTSSEKTATGTASASVTACYKYFYGYTEASDNYSNVFTTKDSLSTLSSAFMSANEATISNMTSDDEKSALVLVLPKSYEITNTQNSLGKELDNMSTTWKKQNVIEYVNGNATTEYQVYVLGSSLGITYKEIKFKK